ncbi:MAG: hypothetical protein J6U21_15100 [Bacteroidales bacterium]|nr:hypothetical protein [Bacteroidales bacterium]
MLTIDLYGRFSSAFGFVAANIRTRTQPHGTPSGVEVYVADATFADLKLKSAKDGKVYEFRNTILNATDKTTFVPDKKFFAPPPILKFDRSKKITATAIAGSDNVVVEDFGLEQWEITMDGLLIDMDAHKYPTAKVQRFRQLFETPDVFDVLECQVMTDLGINALYFTKVDNLAVLENYPDTVKYTLKAKSIQPPEFTISD